MKLLIFDAETTGVNYYQHAIHQLSGAVMINGVITEYFDFRIKPHELALIDDEALAHSNVTREQIMLYEHRTVIHTRLLQMLEKYVDKYNKQDKIFLVGYNNQGFDDKFLRMFFQHEGDSYFGSWFWSNSIDVMVLATQYLMFIRPEMIDFKQSTVALTLGIPVDMTRLHDAIYDVQLLLQIYAKVARPPVEAWML